jgi:hypothetical protein
LSTDICGKERHCGKDFQTEKPSVMREELTSMLSQLLKPPPLTCYIPTTLTFSLFSCSLRPVFLTASLFLVLF